MAPRGTDPRRRHSCLELLDHYIARIERLDGRTNAVVVRDFDRARERARALDRQRSDGRATPLFGVPMTVKESFNLAGLPTTWGYEEHRNSAAHEDALAVQRLTAAGAVVFGKTNVPVSLADWQSYNPVYGATSNPWNLAHTPGGSSGGGAAAMAAGFSALETRQRYRRLDPRAGALLRRVRPQAELGPVLRARPLARARSRRQTDIAVIGPLARSARTCRWPSMRSPAPTRCRMSAASLCRRRARCACRDLRIAVWSSEPGQQTDAETTAHIDALADFLEREGAQVSRTARPEFDRRPKRSISTSRLLTAALSGRAPARICWSGCATQRRGDRPMT